MIIGIDIGGTNFRIGSVQGDGTITSFKKVPTSSILRTKDVLADIADFITEFSAGLSPEAVSIGFPATLNKARSMVVQAPNIAFMENLPVKERLQKMLHIPVVAERDVTFTLAYDMKKYEVSTEGLVCGIYFGTGIGSAFILNGKPFTGWNGAEGELGHIPVPGCRRKCGCGNIGCLETLAGGIALQRIHDEQYPETPIGELFSRHGSDEALCEYVDAQAIAVATEINILDPKTVLVGGGVPNMKDYPKELLRERILMHTRKPLPFINADIIFTDDEKDKSVAGGAIYAAKILNI